MTKRESILQAIVQRLSTIPDVPVFRSRVLPFSRGAFPSITVEFLQDVPDAATFSDPVTSWDLLVRVSVYARGAHLEDAPDQIADPVVQIVHSKMVEDPNLGGLTMDIRASTVKNELLDADMPVAVISLDFLIEYRTMTFNISS